jgi:CRP-like cAMP-binding protein
MTEVATNKVLHKLSAEDRDALAASITLVDLPRGQVLLRPFVEIEFVYFPIHGVCSIAASGEKKKLIEVGMFGSDGMSDLVTRTGDLSYLRTVVLVPGRAFRMKAADFADALARLPSLNEIALRYKDASAVQFAFTSLANGVFPIEARVARWLLMAFDRNGAEALPIVHDLMASTLSVRRSGVTTALHVLEGERAIRNERGRVILRDRTSWKASPANAMALQNGHTNRSWRLTWTKRAGARSAISRLRRRASALIHSPTLPAFRSASVPEQ